jgi:hypothetical protein
MFAGWALHWVKSNARMGLLDHSYTQIEAGEYVTIHIPKDIRILERLLDGKTEDSPEA